MPPIDKHHAAIAEHFAALVRADDYGSRFIDANTEKLWLIEHGAEETVRPLTGNEVLINNCIGQETEAVGSRDAAGLDGTEALVLGGQSLFFASDHSGAHDGCAGAGAGNNAAAPPHFLQRPNRFDARQFIDQALLIAAGQVNTRGLAQHSRGFLGYRWQGFDARNTE